jgi:uncharacterized membrane protein (UPF0127 family)
MIRPFARRIGTASLMALLLATGACSPGNPSQPVNPEPANSQTAPGQPPSSGQPATIKEPATGKAATVQAGDKPMLQIGERTLKVLYAETPAARTNWPQAWPEVAAGLPEMTCVAMDQDSSDSSYGRVWMKGIGYPLDALFIRDGKIVSMSRNMAPCAGSFTKQATATLTTAGTIEPITAPTVKRLVPDEIQVETGGECPVYHLFGSVDYIVSLPGGTADAWNLQVGDAVTPIPVTAKVDPSIVGTWEMAIPAGAYSSGSGNPVISTAGANFGLLTIAADGSYVWLVMGQIVKGQLKAIAPRRYSNRWYQSYSITDGRDTYYFDRQPTWLYQYHEDNPRSDNGVAKGTFKGR